MAGLPATSSDEIRRMKQDIARTKQQSLRVKWPPRRSSRGCAAIAKNVARKAISREKKLDRYLEVGRAGGKGPRQLADEGRISAQSAHRAAGAGCAAVWMTWRWVTPAMARCWQG